MIRPRKCFGQHWLRSQKILAQILKTAQLQPTDRVLEIGPGKGVLTRQLLSQVASLVAVEIDRDLASYLAKTLANHSNFLLIEADILTQDFRQVAEQFPEFFPCQKVVANIPYNITGPILEKLLGTIASPTFAYQEIVLLIQKEVAQRLAATPGMKAYGALSVKIQYLADCELICTVPPQAFYPPPQVDSAVVRLTPRPCPFQVQNPRYLEKLVNLGFAQRRKMLRNNLKGVIDGSKLTQILEKLEINPQARAEELSLSNWIDLSNYLEQTTDHATLSPPCPR